MVGDISTDDGVKEYGLVTEIFDQVGFDEGDVAEIVAAYALGSGGGLVCCFRLQCAFVLLLRSVNFVVGCGLKLEV